MKQDIILLFIILFSSWNVSAQVTMHSKEGGILFQEKGEKILFYQSEPKSYQEKYERCNYIHPLWTLDDTILTEDFPADHLHQRGVYWAWHQVWIDGKRIGDPWEIRDFDQKVTDIEFQPREDGSGILKTKVNWMSDQWTKNGQKVPNLSENTFITIHPKTENYRRIDFEIRLLALAKNLFLGGSEDDKGYGGFSVRMILSDDVVFKGKNGFVNPENGPVESPGYINISGSMGKNGSKAGIVILDHPSNPLYPQSWILRNKNSMQNSVFPGNKPVAISTSEPLVLKYTLVIYSGMMENEQIKQITSEIIDRKDQLRQHFLDRLMNVLPPDRRQPASDQLSGRPSAHISPEDFTWTDWLNRTGELPPNFDELPDLPFLPDPLILDEGGENIPVEKLNQWNKKREQIKKEAQYWITGTVPPSPNNLKAEIVREEVIGTLIERDVIIRFGPENRAQLHITLLIPPGNGPHPVFICPWKKDRQDWVQAAVRRGYIGCRFTATDPKYGYPDGYARSGDIISRLVDEGFAVYAFDQIEFGTRIEEGHFFYQQFPNWSKMGRMVADVRYSVDALSDIEFIDPQKIYTAGYALGATVGLYSAALDERIAGTVSVCGFSPMRTNAPGKTAEGIYEFSHLHGLIPRLGFFAGEESRIPWNFDEIIGCIAPRPVLVIAPS